MILHIAIDESYISEPRARTRNGGHYYLISLPANPEKAPNPPPPSNGPIDMEFRTLKHVVASSDEAEVRTLFHNGQTDVPLRITFHGIVFYPKTNPNQNI